MALLLLGSRALVQTFRLDQSPEIRSLEKPGADFLQQVGLQSHLQVVQVQPLRIIGTVHAHPDMRQTLQYRLRRLYSIRESHGEELVLVDGGVPFYWVDHPYGALALWTVGNLLVLSTLWQGLRQLFSRLRRARSARLPRCRHRSGRLRRWAARLSRFLLALTPLATLAGVCLQALPALALPLHALVWLGWRLRRKRVARLTPSPSYRPIGNGRQEAAILLLSLPTEFSVQIFKELGADAVHAITQEIPKLPPVTPELRRQVIETFQHNLDQMCQGSCPARSGRAGVCDLGAMGKTLMELYMNAPVHADLAPPVARIPRVVHTCPTCAEVFIDAESMEKHKLTHLPNALPPALRPTYCPICLELFPDAESLDKHRDQLDHHSYYSRAFANLRGRKYCCPTCDEAFMDAESLEKHKLAGHVTAQSRRGSRSRRRIFSCPVCDEVFIDSDSLQKHQRRHQLPGLLMVGALLLILSFAPLVLTKFQLALHPFDEAGQRLHWELRRFVSNEDAIVAVVQREHTLSTLVSFEDQQCDDLQPLVQQCAERVGLDPSRVDCMPIRRPHLVEQIRPFLLMLGAMLAILLIRRRRTKAVAKTAPLPAPTPTLTAAELKAADLKLMQIDELSIHVGRGLLGLVDPNQGAKLQARVTAIRSHIAQEVGVRVPGIRFRDNLQLAETEYRISVRGLEVARGSLTINQFLAIGPDPKLAHLRGERTLDPTFGMPGVWITPEQRGDAERLGCMIFDPVSVFATQLTAVIRTYSSQLLTFNAACELLDQPHLSRLMAELEPGKVGRPLLWKVLRLLLAERVSIVDLSVILETVLEYHHLSSHPEDLVEFIRQRLSPSIVQALAMADAGQAKGRLLAYKVPAPLEEVLRQQPGPEQAADLLLQLQPIIQELQDDGHKAILITAPDCRRLLQELTSRLPNVVVLSTVEIPNWANIGLLTPA